MKEASYGKGQRVRLQNQYAVIEYDSLEDAADGLSQIGVIDRDEIRKMLEDRVAYINGYVITYL